MNEQVKSKDKIVNKKGELYMNLFYCSYPYGTASASIFTGTFPWDKQWLCHTRQGKGSRERKKMTDWKKQDEEGIEKKYIIRFHAHSSKSSNSKVQNSLIKNLQHGLIEKTWHWANSEKLFRAKAAWDPTQQDTEGNGVPPRYSSRHVGSFCPEGYRSV